MYRIKAKIELQHWPTISSWSAATAYYVQKRILWIFWYTLKAYWDKDYAERHLEALNDVAKKRINPRNLPK